MAKQYGLITKDKGQVITRPSIFNEDSDSNDDQDKPTGITVLKKKERMAQQKAIDEDPTIYQYDELYDDMQSKRKESKLARKDLDRKPKYINKLLESAERRKKEYERRIERDVQKEREAEGDLYKDKESFVTSAYRKKLEEMKELEEKEKREEYLEAIGDVKKQGDLSGFYRHLYAQQVNYDENSLDENKQKTEDTSKKTEEPSSTSEVPPTLKETSKWDDESSETNEKISTMKIDEQKNTTVPSKKLLDTKKRKYRKREDSKSEEEPEKEEAKKLHHIQSNLDADSDFSIDSESDSENESKKQKTEKQVTKNDTGEENKINASTETQDAVKVEENKDDTEKKEDKVSTDDKKDEPVVPKKPKIDIWKKRTVGDVFDEALKRYYERKAGKMQTVN
ncbi:uncharacterized protein CBL_02334 [Carabus blaptoides fortunei]